MEQYMDSNSEEVLFKLVNIKRREINKRVDNYIRGKKRFNYDNMVTIYMMFAENKNRDLPHSIYIGKTSSSISKRYRQHISEIRRRMRGKLEWNIKYRWMYGIIKNDIDLRIAAIVRVPKDMAYKIEKEMIRYLMEHGFNLINKNNDRYIKNKIYVA